jgi:long-chain acyl-CoA synthetase
MSGVKSNLGISGVEPPVTSKAVASGPSRSDAVQEPGSEPATFALALLDHAMRRPHAPALREKAYGIWQTTTWGELAAQVRAIACGLAATGLRRGGHLAVIGENRPRLMASMLGAQCLGAIAVPLYQDAVAAEFAFPLGEAEVGHAVVEDQEQCDKLFEIRDRCPQLARIWYDDPRGLRRCAEPGVAPFDALLEAGREFDRLHPTYFDDAVRETRADDSAAMFYTSGTTGHPKGVVHSHATLLDRARAGARFDRLDEREEVLAYLPLAWIGQNIFSYAQWLACGYVVNCPESAATVAIDMKEIGPTYYFAPPRVFEALLTSVTIRMADASRPMRWLFDRCMALARRVGPARMDGLAVAPLDHLRWSLGNLLIYAPLRNGLGLARVRVAYTAGEAIGPDLFRFYRAIGVNLKQLYGQTETAVFVCLQPDGEARADTVGVPIEGVELKIEGASGEILVRSPGLLKGYYRNAAATAEALGADGWYRTGDAGFLHASGHLKIIDRARDVGRIAGGAHDGALFAPKYVENKLKFFAYVKEAVAFGDRRERVCAFVNIDLEAVGDWAERRGIAYAGYADLAQRPEVIALVRDCVEQVNADLAGDEQLAASQIARFLVLHKELDADDGELTRTRKVRRAYIADKYAPLVEALYAGRASQHIETAVRFEDGRSGSVAAELRIEDARTFVAAAKAAA